MLKIFLITSCAIAIINCSPHDFKYSKSWISQIFGPIRTDWFDQDSELEICETMWWVLSSYTSWNYLSALNWPVDHGEPRANIGFIHWLGYLVTYHLDFWSILFLIWDTWSFSLVCQRYHLWLFGTYFLNRPDGFYQKEGTMKPLRCSKWHVNGTKCHWKILKTSDFLIGLKAKFKEEEGLSKIWWRTLPFVEIVFVFGFVGLLVLWDIMVLSTTPLPLIGTYIWYLFFLPY